MSDVKLVKCRVLDRNLLQCHGDMMYLEEGKARALADRGLVSYEGYTPLARTTIVPESLRRGLAAAAKPATGTAGATAPTCGSYLSRSAWLPLKAGCRRPRVLWVQDRSRVGGAEMSNDVVVAVGESLGFDIVGVQPGHFPEALFPTADFVVLNNIREFTPEQFYRLQYLCLEEHLPWVKYEHDYRELSRLNVSRPLFQRARLCVFISPRHEALHAAQVGDMNAVAIPLALDVDAVLRAARGVERDPTLVVVPTPRKCGAELQKYIKANPGFSYTLVGPSDISLQGVKGESLPKQNPEALLKLFARAQFVVHLPEQEWAGERVVLEAKLCGAMVVTNERVGHASWTWEDGAFENELRHAPYEFWQEVEQACM